MTRYFIFLAFMPLLTIGQDETVSYRYGVPFPERTYSGEWAMRMELSPTGQTAQWVALAGYNTSGSELFQEEIGPLEARTVFVWSLVPEKQELVQSLVIESDQPLQGVLWLKNEALGQINGVRITSAAKPSLSVPHIARNYFKWKSSFAVVGASPDLADAAIDMRYLNEFGDYGETVTVTEALRSNAYLRRTPFHDVITERVPEMAELMASEANYHLTGFATFSRVEDSLQTCALELPAAGSEKGVALLSPGVAPEHDNFFVFSNPSDQAILVSLTLHTASEYESGTEFLPYFQTINVEPFSKYIGILGGDLFTEYNGEARALTYQVKAVEGASAVPIYALHLQSDVKEEALAGSTFALPGRQLSAWIHAGSADLQLFEFGNYGSDPVEARLSFRAATGESWSQITRIRSGETLTLSSVELAELFELGETSSYVHVSVSRLLEIEEGLDIALAGKLTTWTASDFATVPVHRIAEEANIAD